MHRLKWILFLIVLGLILAAAGFLIWAATPLGPMPEAAAALQSDMQVSVVSGDWISFQPVSGSPTTGFIFYPGGRVDARAYAPPLRSIAAQGYLVVLVPMPLNLAVFASDRAAEVMRAFPQIEHWAVGGHSLGGAMAARFAQEHTEAVSGLALWAAYPDVDLSQLSLEVVSIYGTNDAVASRESLNQSRALLPPDTAWVEIAGGNHSQFGWYGLQPGDNAASISPTDQQAQTAAATVRLLAAISQ